jgi:DNA repair exonuclease SbcCD ATPase subunit
MAIQKRRDPEAPDYLGRLAHWIRSLVDQIRMILDLQTLDDSVTTRLKRLRAIYYPDKAVTVSYRRVRDVLRGHVDKAHYPYYERLLSAERSLWQMTANLPPAMTPSDWLGEMQGLGERIAHLIEQVEQLDSLLAIPANPHQERLLEARLWLMAQIENALTLHNSIPMQVVELKQQLSEEALQQYKTRLESLSNRLEDIQAAYEQPHSEAVRRLMARGNG